MRTPTEVLNEVVERNCWLVASAHHTGTWFALEFLLWHSATRQVAELNDLLNGQELHDDDIVHLHLTGQTIHSRGHVQVDFEVAKETIAKARTLIPLRDPMKAIMSRQQRHPGWDHRFIVDGFCDLPGLDPICFLPIDLVHDARPERLQSCLRVLDLPVEPYIERYAQDWPISNTRGDYELKRIYDMEDLEGLRNRFPMNYDHFINRGNEIIPFLQEQGYKEMPWWHQAKWEDFRKQG